jgi:atypical dual specificity phosphatase
MDSFSWVIDRRLAGMARPGRGRALEQDLRFLERQGVTAIVSLIEPPAGLAEYGAAGFGAHHLPLRNFGVPTLEQLESFCRIVDAETARGGAVAAHCQFGVGRTGIMLIGYLVHEGRSLGEAIEAVRRRRGVVPTDSAERIEVLRTFEALRRGADQ